MVYWGNHGVSWTHSLHSMVPYLGTRPVVGGGLARPYERFPTYFKSDFWKEYPYFLSCLGAASFVIAAFLIGLFFLAEVIETYSYMLLYLP